MVWTVTDGAAALIEVGPVVARMAGPAEDHAAAEITADADHVAMMTSAAAEGRVVRVAHVTNAMTDRAGTMDRGVMIDRGGTPGLVAKTDPVMTGMSAVPSAVMIGPDAMMTSAVGERRVATADPVMNVTTDRKSTRLNSSPV